MKMAARALVIAYDFPPHGAIGTMRTLRLVRRLHGESWEVTVRTGSPRTYLPDTPVERSLEAQVPAGVDVLQVRVRPPLAAFEGPIRRLRRPSASRSSGRRRASERHVARSRPAAVTAESRR